MTQTPTVGRIVHYQSRGSADGVYPPTPRAAIITAVVDSFGTDTHPETRVSLCVLNPTGMFFNTNVQFAETPTPGHWNWPPRVDNTTTVNVVADAVPTVVTDVERQNLGLKRAEVGMRDSQRAVREAQQNLRDTYRNG